MSDHNATPVWRERLASPLTWHTLGFGILLLLVLVLATRFGMDWAATSSRSTDALAGKQLELTAMEMQNSPLRGLDKRVDLTRDQIRDFYANRIPANYSSFAQRIGELSVKSGVRLSRVTYTQGRPGADLTEVSMDAGISGDYPQIMKFVNSLERDRIFFVIKQMALTGQQGGLVNLRLRVSTWMKPAAAAGMPEPTGTKDAAAPASPGEGE